MISINISRALRAKTHFLLDILDDTGSKHVSHRCHHVHKEPICSLVRKSFLCYVFRNEPNKLSGICCDVYRLCVWYKNVMIKKACENREIWAFKETATPVNNITTGQ